MRGRGRSGKYQGVRGRGGEEVKDEREGRRGSER